MVIISPIFDSSIQISDRSLLKHRPEIFGEWNFQKNDELGLDIYTIKYGSDKKVWWRCIDCLSDFSMSPNARTSKGSNCPYCSGYRVNHTNSLASLNPQIALEWHLELNKGLTPHDVYYKTTKKVWWICVTGHEWTASLEKRIGREQGCPLCGGNNRTLEKYNDMWTTNPKLAGLLANPEDGHKYKQNSNKKVDWICECCEEIIKEKTISDINKYGLSCPKCSNNFSFGERFIYSLLSQIPVEFEKEVTFNWSLSKRYDFYVPLYNMIIEVHGDQHYNGRFQTMGGRSLKEEQENDILKEKLAKENGIVVYIVINALDSKVKNIIESIKESGILELVNCSSNILDNVNYLESNFLYLKAWELWNNGLKSVNQIAKSLKVSRPTARAYLKRGRDLNKCDYDVDQSRAHSRKRRVNKKQVIKMSLEGVYIETYNSITDAARINGMSSCSGVSACCNNRRKTSGGFKWKYHEDKIEVKLD